MTSTRFKIVPILAATLLAGCGTSYDCRSKAVHEKVLGVLRDNFFGVIAKSSQATLSSVAAIAGVAGLVEGVAELARDGKASGKNDNPVAGQLDAFKKSASMTFDSITEESADAKQGSYSCRADVRIEAVVPSELRNPLFGVDDTGKVSGNVDVRFVVQPDLSGKSDFVVRPKW